VTQISQTVGFDERTIKVGDYIDVCNHFFEGKFRVVSMIGTKEGVDWVSFQATKTRVHPTPARHVRKHVNLSSLTGEKIVWGVPMDVVRKILANMDGVGVSTREIVAGSGLDEKAEVIAKTEEVLVALASVGEVVKSGNCWNLRR